VVVSSWVSYVVFDFGMLVISIGVLCFLLFFVVVCICFFLFCLFCVLNDVFCFCDFRDVVYLRLVEC